MKITLRRDVLYQELWSAPMGQIQDKYGITYHRLKKVCTKLNIPTPPSGYWSKVRNGKHLKQPSLPKSEQFSTDIWIDTDKKIDLKEKLPKKIKPIVVKKTLRNPHHLVKKTYNNLKDSRINQFNRVKPYRGGFLDVSVGTNSLKRAMRIMDALVKELNRQGFIIGTKSEGRSSKSYITIGQEEIYFQIREEGYRKTIEPNPAERWPRRKYKYFTNGKLKLGISSYPRNSPDKTLRDLKSKKLEDRLGEFFPLALELAAIMKKRKEEREVENRIRERRRKLREQSERQVNQEIKRLESLEKHAKSFTKSQYIYELINKVEEEILKHNLNEQEKLQANGWVQWATNHADRLNPVKQAVKSIFEEK